MFVMYCFDWPLLYCTEDDKMIEIGKILFEFKCLELLEKTDKIECI